MTFIVLLLCQSDSYSVDLRTPGTYKVKFTCMGKTGVKATPRQRTVVVDPAYSDDFWEGDADISIDGYTKKTFLPMRAAFIKSLAAALGIDAKGEYANASARLLRLPPPPSPLHRARDHRPGRVFFER
jgi:hypothetical protein